MKNDTLLQLIIDQSKIGFWDWNIKTNKIKISDSAKIIFGFKVDELPNVVDISFIHTIIYPDDYKIAIENMQVHYREKGLNPYETVVRYYHQNGSIIWLLSRGKVLDWAEDGTPVRIVGSHIDITNQKNLEEDVRINKDILHNIINNIPYCVFWKDTNSVFRGGNKPFADFYGYKSIDEIMGLPTTKLINHPKELLEKYVEVDKKVMLSGKIMMEIVENAINKNGERIIIQTAKVPLKDKDGKSIGLLGIFNDITETENLKKELLNSSKLYHIISQINKLLLNIGTKENFFQEICNIITSIGGFKLAFIGMMEEQKRNFISYAGESSEYLEGIQITVDDNEYGSGPTGFAIKNNKKYICNDFQNDISTIPWRKRAKEYGLLSSAVFPIRNKGKSVGALTVYENVPDYFQNKEIALLEEIVVAIELGMEILEHQSVNKIANNKGKQLTDIIQLSKSFVGIISAKDQSLVYLNDALRKAYELTPDEDVTKYKVTDFRDIDDILLIKNTIFPTVKSEGLWSGEGSFISKNGKVIPILQNVIPLKNEQDEIEFYATTALDITELKNNEKELKKLNEELRSLSHHLVSVKEKERKLIAKDIHDELGQDLTALKIGVSWLVKHIDDDKENIISKLNEVSDIASSTIQTSRRLYNSIYPQMLEEVGLLDTIRWHYKSYLQDEDLIVKIVSNSNEECLFAGNHDLCLTLFRVYQEAFTNILHYANATEVVINITIKESFVNMIIQDNGIGFDPSKIDRRLHHGLLGMRERVTAMDGTLLIDSQINIGTSVSVTLRITEDILNPAD